ncbi:MAG TPA: hypothetical protein VFQ07_15060 [Candidatus Polarisedimenticolia bacterium]|nr:hypothetical protein [Candidatus Polarisedimenticolia bacterium]
MTRAFPGTRLLLPLLVGAATLAGREAWAPPVGGALYQDLGAGITTVVLSDPYPDGGRLLWACGTNVVAKIDAAGFDVIATLRHPGGESDDSGRRERVIAAIDAGPPGSASDWAAASAAAPPDAPAPLLDADNRLILSEERALVAYGDAEPGARLSGIRVVQRFELAASIPGRFTGLAKTADGHLIATTSAGFVVAVARGFARLTTVRLPHAPSGEVEDFVRGGPILDDRGGVYVATAHHLHRVAWDGANLSTAPEAGAWSEKVSDGCAPGASPVFPGGGSAGDRLVAVATAGRRATVAAFWREEVPDPLPLKPGATALRSRLAAEEEIPFIRDRAPEAVRDAGKDGGDAAATAARLFASPDGVLAYDGASGGLAVLTWDPGRRLFVPRSSSDLRPGGGVVLSPDGRTAWFLVSEGNQTRLHGFDIAGAAPSRRVIGGARFFPRGATPILDPQGRLVSGCLFGVMRVKLEP